MRFTKEELDALDDYLLALAPDLTRSFRTCGEIMDLSNSNLVMYKAMVNVMREQEDGSEPQIGKEVVYFVETHEMEVRKTTNWNEAIYAALVYNLVQEFTGNFDVVSNVVASNHPRTLQ